MRILLYINAPRIPYFMQSERIGGMFIPFEERRRKIRHLGINFRSSLDIWSIDNYSISDGWLDYLLGLETKK